MSRKTYSAEQPYDASFSCGSLSIDGRSINAFPDDAEPVRVENVSVAELIPSVNGSYTVAKKPIIAKITISILPGTDDEKVLSKKFSSSMNLNKEVETCKISTTLGNGTSYTFDTCVCIGSTPGFSVSPNGKIHSMTYVFAAIGKIY